MNAQTRHFTDYITYMGASGWVFAESGTVSRVKAVRNGEVIAETSDFYLRPDVASHFANFPNAGRSGFSLSFNEARGALRDVSTVRIFAECGEGEILIGEGLTADSSIFRENLKNIAYYKRNEFPVAIGRSAYASSEGHEVNIDSVCQVLNTQELRSVSEISDYARYVSSCWSHFNFVAKCFPSMNSKSMVGEKDFLCKQNSALEMMSIAHYLYVIKSYGAKGALAEFGCFKGFSSSMLSFACSLLGIDMHIYDSFEGLPISTSTYYKKGDFSGSLPEVKENIAQFGVIEPVVFHKGFFADSLSEQPPPPLMTLWMDVDLSSSASDVIPAAKMLSPLGAIFSHECGVENFSGPSPSPGDGGPNDVVPAILSYYKGEMANPAGLFVAGNTGAFWRAGEGIPVLPTDQLRRVLQTVAI